MAKTHLGCRVRLAKSIHLTSTRVTHCLQLCGGFVNILLAPSPIHGVHRVRRKWMPWHWESLVLHHSDIPCFAGLTLGSCPCPCSVYFLFKDWNVEEQVEFQENSFAHKWKSFLFLFPSNFFNLLCKWVHGMRAYQFFSTFFSNLLLSFLLDGKLNSTEPSWTGAGILFPLPGKKYISQVDEESTPTERPSYSTFFLNHVYNFLNIFAGRIVACVRTFGQWLVPQTDGKPTNREVGLNNVLILHNPFRPIGSFMLRFFFFF